jgi:translation initiation factor 2B subunit (eIF-2B alpha/beta/delta family)
MVGGLDIDDRVFGGLTRHEPKVGPEITFDSYTIDFTPAAFITLLFTDLGVLTPAAVSDELIKLYQLKSNSS